MKQINLRKIYPHCTVDRMVDVPDDVASLIWASERAEKAYDRKLWRYQAIVSLDHPCFSEHAVGCYAPSAAEEYELLEQKRKLHQAMQSIPQVQAERIYAHYVQKKSYFEIAAEEGVNKQTVYLSIQRGIAKIRKIMVEPQKVD